MQDDIFNVFKRTLEFIGDAVALLPVVESAFSREFPFQNYLHYIAMQNLISGTLEIWISWAGLGQGQAGGGRTLSYNSIVNFVKCQALTGITLFNSHGHLKEEQQRVSSKSFLLDFVIFRLSVSNKASDQHVLLPSPSS